MKIEKAIPAKVIFISAIIIGMGAGATAHMVKPLEKVQDKDKGNASIRIADEDKDKINEHAVPGKAAEAIQEAPIKEKPAEATAEPVVEPEAPVEAETKPQTYKWSAEMTAAGIAAADQGYVTDMVLEDFGWRVVMREKPVWHLARQTHGTLTEQLIQVNKYVGARYEGSWAAAHAEYVAKGNF